MLKNKIARLAGFTYLILVITGLCYLLFLPKQFIEWGDAAATVNNIVSGDVLFRLWVFIGIISSIVFLILPFILFKLFESVNRTVAFWMVVLAVVSVPYSLSYSVSLLDILSYLGDEPYLNVLNTEQIHAQVMLLLNSYVNGMSIVQVFWGLWLFPFGYLAYQSNYLPRIFGIALMLGCFSYLIKFTGSILFPDVDIPGFVGYPSAFGEIGTCLWLLVMGVRCDARDDIT